MHDELKKGSMHCTATAMYNVMASSAGERNGVQACAGGGNTARTAADTYSTSSTSAGCSTRPHADLKQMSTHRTAAATYNGAPTSVGDKTGLQVETGGGDMRSADATTYVQEHLHERGPQRPAERRRWDESHEQHDRRHVQQHVRECGP